MVKTALVTGSAGFVGRNMVKELVSRGYRVTELDVETSDEWTWCDFGPGDALGWFATNEDIFDLTVHCAYHVGGRAAIDGTNTNFAKNLQLDASLFEWAIRTGQKRVLYFSSSAAYPVSEQTKWCADNYLDARLEEDDIDLRQDLGMPDANYGWAKVTGERLAEDARRSGLAVSMVRPFSGYGEDQSLDYPFPSIVKRAREGDLTVWGPQGQTRDWIHVDDVVNGALAVVDSGTELPVNLCTGVGTEMGALAEIVRSMELARTGNPDGDGQQTGAIYDESKPTGVFYRVGDPTRMLQYYTPKISLEEGIRRALQA